MKNQGMMEPPEVGTAEAVTPRDAMDLIALVKAPVHVTLAINQRKVLVEARCLTTAESRELQSIIDAIKPPMVMEEGKDPRPDWEDSGFRARQAEAARLVRALAIYKACPVVRSKTIDAQPEASRAEAIVRYMDESFTERMLQLLYVVITKDCSLNPDEELELGTRVSFTSPAS